MVGELTVAALVIERGARFEGQVKMTGKDWLLRILKLVPS